MLVNVKFYYRIQRFWVNGYEPYQASSLTFLSPLEQESI